MKSSLLQQIKKRRLALGLKQNDMMLRIGISRQQYQRMESKGNPRLNTMELIAKGLNSEFMLIPKEKLGAVQTVLKEESIKSDLPVSSNLKENERKALFEDPWQDLLGDTQ